MSNKLLDLFVEHLNIEKGLSKNTLLSYKSDINDFTEYLATLKPIVFLENATKENIRSYLAFINSKNYTEKSQARKLSALKSFYQFLIREGEVKLNPSEGISSPKLGKSLPKSLSEDEVLILITSAYKKDKMTAVMLEILYATGIRVSELVALKLSDIKDNYNFLLVLGKGDKEREVPLIDVVKDVLQQWVLEHKNKYKKTVWLFPGRTNNKHITRVGFALRLKNVAILAGIDPLKVSPHKLRHSFATHMLSNGADLKTIKDILGHADISTVEIYTHVSSKRLQNLVNTKHPLNKNYFK